jgi:hypothetical protein
MDLIGGRVDELAALTEDEVPIRLETREDLSRLVRCAQAVDDLTAGAGARTMAKTDRTILLLLARRTDDPGLATLIDKALRPCADDDPGRAGRRAEARLRHDPSLARTLGWLERQLAPAHRL